MEKMKSMKLLVLYLKISSIMEKRNNGKDMGESQQHFKCDRSKADGIVENSSTHRYQVISTYLVGHL